MERAQFVIETDVVGVTSITMNGEDITQWVRALQIYTSYQDPTIIGIEFVKSRVKINGPLAVQALAEGVSTAPAEAVKALDWNRLEAEALESMGMGDNMTITEALKARVVEALERGTEAG